MSAAIVVQPSVAFGQTDNELEVRLVVTPSFAPQWPPDLVIQGTWANSCLPSIVRTTLVDAHIDIHLRSNDDHCADIATPMSLKVNPAREAGLTQLALGTYQVRLYLIQFDGTSELIAFRLLRSGADDTASRPENGFWQSVPTAEQTPALTGSGLSIEQQGDNLAVTLLTHENGAPVWYFGSAKMPGNHVRVPLVRMIGGDEPFAVPNAAPSAEPGISLNMQFLTPSHANGWLVRPRPESVQTIEMHELNLLRRPFENGHPGTAWQGEWALVFPDATQARVIKLLDLATADAESFRLNDRVAGVSLHCRMNDIGGHPTPEFCSLHDGADVLADFDQVGMNRLSGMNMDGNAVRLVRLPR